MKNELTLMEMLEKTLIDNSQLLIASWWMLAGISLFITFLSEISKMKKYIGGDTRFEITLLSFLGCIFSLLFGVNEFWEYFK